VQPITKNKNATLQNILFKKSCKIINHENNKNKTRPYRVYILVKPYTFKEFCDLYGVADKTLKKWLKPFKSQIGERLGWYYTVLQVETIFNKIGVPYRISN